MTLLVIPGGWQFVKLMSSQSLLDAGYFPASPGYPEVAFSIKMVKDWALNISEVGLSFQQAWFCILRQFLIPPPMDIDIEDRFRTVVQICIPAFIKLEQGVEIGNEETLNEKDNEVSCPKSLSRSKGPDSRFSCPICFSDRLTKKYIVLVISPALLFMNLKHLASPDNSLSDPRLDQIYYINPEASVKIKEVTKSTCVNIRSGDENRKSVPGLDVYGLFGTSCVHGFPYEIIDIKKGESAIYIASIVKRFRMIGISFLGTINTRPGPGPEVVVWV